MGNTETGRFDFVRGGKTRLERFLEKVSVQADGCWEWRGASTGGYGEVGIGSRVIKAHAFLVGVPYGCCLHHKCYNRLCVRPDHLAIMSKSAHSRLHGERRKCAHGDLRRNASGDCLECDRLRSQRRRQDPAFREQERAKDRERLRRRRQRLKADLLEASSMEAAA